MKILVLLSILCSFIAPEILSAVHANSTASSSEPDVVAKISRKIDIPPDSDYVIRFNSQNLTLQPEVFEPLANGLPESVIAAIAKSPQWIQPRLTSQFQTLNNPESYAGVLLNASKKIADEIAFSIACSPIGRVPAASLLKENAEALYEHDQWIDYADIVEYDDGMGNYFSTIRYKVLENGVERYTVLPSEIYYWYVVHPEITNEEIDAVYGPLWRDYLFEHNDLGYPLLKEKLSAIPYLWDCQAYYQSGERLWSVCINQHPTAIEAISYWIGKTVPNPATGDRPGQASVIAHEHNGWCGELQKIAVAAQRAALVPSIAVCNVGEDHVWREFYEQGWHENDNWWNDAGGAVDEPDVYAYGWGKNMSAIYQWRGDGTILQDTTRYIHKEDRITVDFQVKDIFRQPVDGARVIVMVKGPKDITYYKNLIWGKVQNLWDNLPDFLKGKLLSYLFSRIEGRFDQIPDVINGTTITTWNYTDSSGRCSVELGKNIDYLFLIQAGNLKKPWQLARHNLLRSLKTGQDKAFTIILFDVSHKSQRMTSKEIPSGNCSFSLHLNSTGYQLQKHFFNDGIGRVDSLAGVECFFVDQVNFQRYQQGKSFVCYNYLNVKSAIFTVSTLIQDWYFVLKNYGRQTHVIVDFSFDVAVQTTTNHVQIVTPNTMVFETPVFNCGDHVPLSGIATTDFVYLSFDHASPPIECPVMNGEWSYVCNTSGKSIGTHAVTVATAENISDEAALLLIDAIPPSLTIDTPVDGAIREPGILTISGQCSDNLGVDHVEVTLENSTNVATGSSPWNLSWDLSGFPLGDYQLVVQAFDTHGLVSIQTRSFVLNDSGHTWGPQINAMACTPLNPTNSSNMIIYANVTSTSPFAIRDIILYCDNGTDTVSHEMYRYGQFPIQSRHEEDPFFNQSNAPLFGVELGQFSSGQTIGFWIVATDTAGNRIQSEGDSFTIS